MTREDINLRLNRQKIHNGELKSSINNYKQDINSKQGKIQHLESELHLSQNRIADLEKQLAEIEIEVYEPIYIDNSFNPERQIKIDRHNAGEELKKLISEENAKQGWKVDWEDEIQKKWFIYYDNVLKKVSLDFHNTDQYYENGMYFSYQSSKDQEFLGKTKPLWLKWKGITNV